jgi:hypothetical protein
VYSRRLGEKIIHRDYGAGKGVKNLLTSKAVMIAEQRPRLPKQESGKPLKTHPFISSFPEFLSNQ